jgi:hypothetical protein
MLGMRYDNWKLVFMEQRTPGTMRVWADPFTRLRMPKLFNLRTDPYEYADITSNSYYDYFLYNAYFIYAAQVGAAKFAATFKDFPAVQKPNTFTVDDALKAMSEATGSSSTRRGGEDRSGSRRRPGRRPESFVAQRFHGRDSGGAARGQEGRRERGDGRSQHGKPEQQP